MQISPKCGDGYGKSTFFVYPPERGEIGQSLPRLAHFNLRPLQTDGSLRNDVLLHHCIQTVVPNHLSQAMNQSFFHLCFSTRHTLGKFWRSAKVTCQYPDHDGVRKRIQGRDVITLHMSQDIQKLFGVIIPVESGSLQKHFLLSIFVS